jgi:hypothetical protein
MKTLSFLDTANAFRWMADNLFGKVRIFNFKRFDILIVQHEKTCDEIRAEIKAQTDETQIGDFNHFENLRRWMEKHKNNIC